MAVLGGPGAEGLGGKEVRVRRAWSHGVKDIVFLGCYCCFAYYFCYLGTTAVTRYTHARTGKGSLGEWRVWLRRDELGGD